jgi:hypothetical protein
VGLKNLTAQPLKVTLQATSIVPTLGGESAATELAPHASLVLDLPVTVAAAAEWGRRTVTLELRWGESTAVFFRRFVVLSPPELEVRSRLYADGDRRVLLKAKPNRLGEAGTVQSFAVSGPIGRSEGRPSPALGGQAVLKLGKVETAPTPELRQYPVRIDCQTGSLTRTVDASLFFPALPETLPAGRADAVPVIASNQGDEAIGPTVVSTRLPARWRTGRMVDAWGRALPCQLTNPESKYPELLVAVALPPRSASLCWLLPEAPLAAPTDLTVGWQGQQYSGSATVQVSNSFLTVAIAEAAGGTVSSLVSKRTGRDYGQQSFDAATGRFTAPDRPQPAADTVQTIREEKQRLSILRARVDIEEQGPLRITIRATAPRGGAVFTTRYEFTAYTDAFRVFRGLSVLPDEPAPEEYVVLDTAFRPHGLSKTYPSFTGIEEEAPQPHYGWRYSDWVPELISLFNPDARDEAISLFVDEANGIDRVRQGFWPLARPSPGPRALASVEFISRRERMNRIAVVARVHPGYHLQAKQWRAARQAVELSLLDRRPQVVDWPEPAPADWWHPAWPLRARAEATEEALRDGSRCALRIDPDALADGGLDSASVRLFERTEGRLLELACALDETAGEVTFAPAGNRPFPRNYEAYFDRRGAPAKPAGPWGTAVPVIGRLLADFESDDGWRLDGVLRVPGRGREGSVGLAFDSAEGAGGPRVAVCRTALPEPRSRYRVHFWARAEGDRPALACNVYGGARYDFGQVHTPLSGDGQWHFYEIEVATGDFPATAAPQLRFWTMPGGYAVSLDDVVVERLGARSWPVTLLPARCESLPPAP